MREPDIRHPQYDGVRSLVCPFRWRCCSILDGDFASHRAFCVAADSVRKLTQDCPPCLRQVPVSETLRRAGCHQPDGRVQQGAFQEAAFAGNTCGMGYFKGRVVVVTGAGAGIGRQLAIQLAAQGAKLALIDIDQGGLEETVELAGISANSVMISARDVTDREAMGECAAATLAQFGHVDAIFNNAGVLYSGTVEDSDYPDIEHVMNVDFWGVVNGSKAFLPYIIASDRGSIVNISSAFGLMAAPGYSAYNSAKFAVRGFTESLRQEMFLHHRQVAVTCVFPGGIKTSIARTARVATTLDHSDVVESFESSIARTDPADAAKTILRGVERRRPRVLIGNDARIVDVLTRVASSGYQRIIPALKSG